jgi:hypothetical protein
MVWQAKNFQDMMIVKTLLYTGVRVSELINIMLSDVDFHYSQIRINKGKGSKYRIVPFPQSFKEMLAMHADSMRKKQAFYLFESSWKKKYPDRGIRKILAKYSEEAGLVQNLSPHKWQKRTLRYEGAVDKVSSELNYPSSLCQQPMKSVKVFLKNYDLFSHAIIKLYASFTLICALAASSSVISISLI